MTQETTSETTSEDRNEIPGSSPSTNPGEPAADETPKTTFADLGLGSAVLRALVDMAITPLLPRPLLGNSSISVRLP